MSQLRFAFDFEKTLQASALVMRIHGGTIGMMRLLKILYIVDRELLAETGNTLTGDQAYAMKKIDKALKQPLFGGVIRNIIIQ